MTRRPSRLKHPVHKSPFSSGNRTYWWQQAIALPVFLVALGLYVLTLAPTVVSMFDDSLEFQLVTYLLGIAHPPGYPLYTVLGWLFTQIPIGDVAYRVNLMSAVFGAVTVALVYLIGLELTPATQPQESSSKGYSEGDHQPWIGVLAALIGALALALSPVFWSQATVAEVYTLNAAFVASILWLLVRGGRQETDQVSPPSEKWLLALAFLFGLSLAHHRTMVLLLPAIIFYLWRQSRAWRQGDYESHSLSSLVWTGAKLAAALAIPLLLYLYIPLRGHVGSLDGTYTNTLAGFWQHVTASGYRVFFFQNPFGAERGVDYYFSLFLIQFGLLGLVAGLIGLLVLLRRKEFGFLGVAFLTYLAFNLFYRVADIEVFFIPLFLIWAIWIGVAAGWLLTGLESVSTINLSRLRLPVAVVIVLVFATQSVILLRDNLPALNRSDQWAVHDYGLDMMNQPLELDASIVGMLGETTLVRYFQEAEGLRPDLRLVAADGEAERLAAVERLMDEGQEVYLTRDLPGAPARWSLSAVGPLTRVNPEPVLSAPGTPIPVGSSLISEIVLYGYAISRPPAHNGPPPVRMTLIWQVTASIPRALKVSTRLTDADGQPVAQADAVPVHFAYPTTAWRPGEFISDVYDLALPDGFSPGEYVPLIILYEPTGGGEVSRLTLPPVHIP